MYVPVWKYLASTISLREKEYKKFVFPLHTDYVKVEGELKFNDESLFEINPYFSVFELKSDTKTLSVAVIDSDPLSFVYFISDDARNIMAVEHEVINKIAGVVKRVKAVAKTETGYVFVTSKVNDYKSRVVRVDGVRMRLLYLLNNVIVSYRKFNYLMMRKIEKEYKCSG